MQGKGMQGKGMQKQDPIQNRIRMEIVKKYNCLIVDDEPPAREVLRRYIDQLPILALAGECANALQALSVLKQQPVDLLFLDIQMPQITGMDMIRTLIGTQVHPPRIVLTTAYEQYAVQAFELDVADYLVKPIRFERFLKSVMKALPDALPDALPANALPDKTLVDKAPADQNAPPTGMPAADKDRTANSAFLYFRAERKMVKVLLADIVYAESLKDYVKIHTAKGTLVTKHTMAGLEAMLPASGFVRVHRSFLIAFDKIDSFTADQIEINGHLIPIGKLYRQLVLKLLNGG